MIWLSDLQWERICHHFPEENIADGGLAAGRSRHARFLKGRFGYSTPARNGTCSRSAIRTTKRFIAAFRRGVAVKFCAAFSWISPTNCATGVLDEEECFIDATFVMAKGGGAEVGPTKRGKGMKIMAIVDRHGLPLSVSTHAANHHEVRLVQLCFDFYMIEAKPENLIGDRAYDSDPLDHALRQDGIEMIAPHRSNRTKPPTQDRRGLRRSAALVGRTLLRLDPVAAPDPRPMGISSRELSWLRSTRLPRCPLQAILR